MKHLNSNAAIKFAFDAFKKNIILLGLCGLIVGSISYAWKLLFAYIDVSIWLYV